MVLNIYNKTAERSRRTGDKFADVEVSDSSFRDSADALEGVRRQRRDKRKASGDPVDGL